jgi:hypothetical protein
MKASDYWQIFLDTGAPEMYLFYQNARKMESNHVLDDSGTGITSHKL